MEGGMEERIKRVKRLWEKRKERRRKRIWYSK